MSQFKSQKFNYYNFFHLQRFAMTENWASPPVDLSQAVVLLPEATPITEAPQEPKLTSSRKTG